MITVTEDDIKAGWAWSWWRMTKAGKFDLLDKRCQRCPVAIATARSTEQKVVTVETYRIHVGKVVYRTPEIVSDWMYDFDKGFLDMKPFQFELMELAKNVR